MTEGAHPILTCVNAEGVWEELVKVKTVRQAPAGAVSFPAGQIKFVLPWVESPEILAELVEELKGAGLSVQIQAKIDDEES